MILNSIQSSSSFVSAYFSATDEEKEQLAKCLNVPIEEMKGCEFCTGQFIDDTNMIDCIQVYTDTWESNCDMVFTDFKEDCIKELHDFMNELVQLGSDDKRKEKLGKSIKMEVAA